MLLGYNTNGLAHHRLSDAIALLAEEGYRSVALTLDAGALDPYVDPSDLAGEVARTATLLDRHGLGRVVETGAGRFLLNPERLNIDPTLLDPRSNPPRNPRRLPPPRDRHCPRAECPRRLDLVRDLAGFGPR